MTESLYVSGQLAVFAGLDALLRERLWAHRPDVGEDGYTCYERNGIRLEIAFLARDDRGHVYTPLMSGGRGEWPSDSFGDEVAQLNGVHARVAFCSSSTHLDG